MWPVPASAVQKRLIVCFIKDIVGERGALATGLHFYCKRNCILNANRIAIKMPNNSIEQLHEINCLSIRITPSQKEK
jgi:hypothetical protein